MKNLAQPNWLEAARDCAAAGRPCALVTVTAVKGSAPREAGAHMLVTETSLFGTIGGGHLEQQAIAQARALLTESGSAQIHQTFALGPELGQCCGGSVDIAIEPLLRDDADTLRRWALDYQRELPTETLYLFGAGHVGLAVAQIAATLPYRLTWIDSRPETVAQAAALGIDLANSAQPALEVDSAPAQTFFLIMTHSHALDLEICERVLRRRDFAFLGLIGSATKRAKFAKRLRNRGIPADSLARLTCPIGVGGIHSKLPAAIAVAAMAQILQLSEKTDASGLKIA